MLIYIKIAILNVHKKLKSLWLNGAGIALAVIAIVFIFSLSRGIKNQMVMRSIKFETGAVTLTLKKELTTYEYKQTGDELFARLCTTIEEIPEINDYRTRLIAYNTMLYVSAGEKRITLVGITPDEVPLLSDNLNILEGTADWEGTADGIIVSEGLAEEVGLTVGDGCMLVLQTADGTVNMQDFTVMGLFLDTSMANKYMTYASYEKTKELYYANLPNRLLIDVYDLHDAERVKARLQDAVSHPWLEVEAYTDNLSSAQALASINKYAWSGVAFFLLLISFVGIWAMEVENINERRKEIGTLLSFGFSRRAVKGIFLIESLYVSFLFILLGMSVVVGAILLINAADGVYLGRSASFAFGSSVIKPELGGSDVLLAVVVALFYPLLATWLSLKMMNKMQIVKLLLVSMFVLLPVNMSAQTADTDYLARIDEALYMEYADVRMEILKNDKLVKEYEMEYYRQGPKMRMEFTAPAVEKGRHMLNDESNMWMYMPRTSKVIKLPLKQPFMGSDASNRDLMRLAYQKDYKLVGNEAADGDIRLLTLEANDLSVSYNKVIISYDGKRNLPLRQEMFSLSGKLVKTMAYEYDKQADNAYSVTEVIIKDELLKNSLTKMYYKNCKRSNDKPAVFFTLGSLKQ